MSAQIAIPFCFRCQRYPDPDDAPLKWCGRCRSRHYCSAGCQRNDWPRHKQECSTLAAGGEVPNRSRTTMRLNMGSLMGRSEEAEPDLETIYYLKTSKPHLQDISISGPFYPLKNVVEQMHYRLAVEKSDEGERMLEEIMSAGLESMEHINAPLPDGNIMKLQLLREKNAEVARSLPGDVWKVIVMTPNMGGNMSGEHPPIKQMDIHRTFTTKEEANEAARQLLEELKAKAGRKARVDKTTPNGLVEGFLITPGTDQAKIVQVLYDDGSVTETGFGDT